MSEEQPPAGPWGQAPPEREPAINAPWPSLVVVGVILGSYLLQSLTMSDDQAAALYGLTPAGLLRGHWLGVVGMMFVHGGWLHAITNAVAALAFGPPVARLLGEDLKGAAAFFGFYLLCGVLAGLGYA